MTVTPVPPQPGPGQNPPGSGRAAAATPSSSPAGFPRRTRAVLQILLVATLLAGTVTGALASFTALGWAPVLPSAPGAASPPQVQLRYALQAYLAARPLDPGAALSVTSPSRGLRLQIAAGRRSLLGGALSAADPFRSASVTKTFTAGAVLRLTETGRLGLDDPIAEHLPPAVAGRLTDAFGGPTAHRITVRQLLNHTSGIPDYGTDPRWLATVATHPRRIWTPSQLLDYALTHSHPTGTPGQRFAYSDTGYLLLAFAIEHLTARPLAAAYRTLLPMAALTDTYLEGREPPPPDARPRAHQYLGLLDTTRYDPSFDNFGGGGLITTVADLDTFTRALFTGHVYAHPGTLSLMLDTAPDGHGDRYGLGIGLRRLAGEDVWLHTGFFGGVLAYVPRLDLTIAATTNQTLADPGPLLASTVRTVRQLPADERAAPITPATPTSRKPHGLWSVSTPAVLAPLLPRTRSQPTRRNAGSATRLNRSSNLR